MKENEKVSVILPVYNGEKYIRETIKSILQSEYRNIEVLIIDDGSTDNSLIYSQLLSVEPSSMISSSNSRMTASVSTAKRTAERCRQETMASQRHPASIYASAIRMIL